MKPDEKMDAAHEGPESGVRIRTFRGFVRSAIWDGSVGLLRIVRLRGRSNDLRGQTFITLTGTPCTRVSMAVGMSGSDASAVSLSPAGGRTCGGIRIPPKSEPHVDVSVVCGAPGRSRAVGLSKRFRAASEYPDVLRMAIESMLYR